MGKWLDLLLSRTAGGSVTLPLGLDPPHFSAAAYTWSLPQERSRIALAACYFEVSVRGGKPAAANVAPVSPL